MVFERIDEQLLGGVHHDAHVLVADALHHDLIGIIGHGVGNAACKDQGVAGLDTVDFLEQSLQLLFVDVRTLTVDLGLLSRLDFDVDTRNTLFELDEIGNNVVVANTVFDRLAGEACHKAVGSGIQIQLGKHKRYVDTLAAVVVFLACGAVGDAACQLVEPHNVVD